MTDTSSAAVNPLQIQP